MAKSEEITGGYIITEHYKGAVVNFFWFETLKEAEAFAAKNLDHNASTYVVAKVV